ncbi:MAG: hypothetical protein HC903_12040 [Methylacidiphilales bacterium]|nr:hypothetical protein [Candidatus Methylacidiphilales bacterium]
MFKYQKTRTYNNSIRAVDSSDRFFILLWLEAIAFAFYLRLFYFPNPSTFFNHNTLP